MPGGGAAGGMQRGRAAGPLAKMRWTEERSTAHILRVTGYRQVRSIASG